MIRYILFCRLDSSGLFKCLWLVALLSVINLSYAAEGKLGSDKESLEDSVYHPDLKNVQKCMRDEDFSRALGTLIYEDVAKKHNKLIDAKIFLTSILEEYRDPVSGEMYAVIVKRIPDSEGVGKTSEIDISNKKLFANDVLKNRNKKRGKEASNFDFVSSYAKKTFKEDSDYGIYTRMLKKDDIPYKQKLYEKCEVLRNNHREFTADRKRDANWICSQKISIDRLAQCKIENGMTKNMFKYVDGDIEVDYFETGFTKNYKNVYKSWNEVLLTLDKEEGRGGIHEVVIPANVLYAEEERRADSTTEHQWYLLLKMDQFVNAE